MAQLRWPGFDDLRLDDLRQRRSEKWTRYPADVLPAAVAEMDFPLAAAIRTRLHEAVELGDVGYASPDQHELADAYAMFAREQFDWSIDPAGVAPATDVMVGVAEVLRLVTSRGAGVVINPPVYPPFFSTIAEVGRHAVEVPLIGSVGRADLDLDGIERAFAHGAQAYLLCNPHNPLGRVWSADDLRPVAELASAYGVAVIADEVHAPLVLAPARFQPYLALGGDVAAHGVSISAATKAWNFAGLKCAVITTDPGPMRRTLEDLPVDLLDRVGHLGVLASIAAWHSAGHWRATLLKVLDRNRRLLASLLDEHLPAVRYHPPDASYLAWLDCRQLGLGDNPAETFLEHGRVGLYPGLRFGRGGAGFVRFNFGTSAAMVTDMVGRMTDAIAAAAR